MKLLPRPFIPEIDEPLCEALLLLFVHNKFILKGTVINEVYRFMVLCINIDSSIYLFFGMCFIIQGQGDKDNPIKRV